MKNSWLDYAFYAMHQLVDRRTSEIEVDNGIDIELVFFGTVGEAPEVVADASEPGEKIFAGLHGCSRKQTPVRFLRGFQPRDIFAGAAARA